MMKEWVYNRETHTYTIHRYFDSYKYQVQIYPDNFGKSVHFRVGATSGVKRKELDIYEDKPNKSLGGIKALLWIKQVILDFPQYYVKNKSIGDTKLYICIQWEDSRRKKVYSRLTREGFRFQRVLGEECLIKQIIL